MGSPVSKLTRGETTPRTACWTWCREGLAPYTRTGWPSADKTSARGCESRMLDPLPGTARTPSLGLLQGRNQRAQRLSHRHTRRGRSREGPCRVQQDTTGHRGRKGDPHYQIRLLLRTSRDRLTKRQQERLREAFTADEAHNECRSRRPLRPARARRLPPSHTRPLQAPGLTPHEAPTNVSHPRNCSPGPDPTHVKGRTRRLFRHRRSKQRPHRIHQRNHRIRQRNHAITIQCSKIFDLLPLRHNVVPARTAARGQHHDRC